MIDSQLSRVLAFSLFFASLGSLAVAHEWTSRNGKFKVEAEFVAVKDGKVVLEKADGSYVSVPLNLISEKDIEYIESITGKKLSIEGDIEKPASSVEMKPKVIKLKGSKADDPPGVVRDFGDQGWGIRSLAFSGDGSILVAGKTDQIVSVFDVNEGSRLNMSSRLEEVGPVETVAVSRDGTRLVAGGSQGIIRTWRMTPEGALKDGVPFGGHSQEINAIVISPDGRFALSGSRDKTAQYWQIDTGKEFATFDEFQDNVTGLWISDDGLEGMATDGQMLARIDLKTKEAVMTRLVERSSPQFAAFSPDGKTLAVSDGSKILLWNLKPFKELPPLNTNDIQWCGEFTPDSTRLVTGGNALLSIWDVQTQKRVGVLTNEDNGYIKAVAMSPDGEHVAACSGNSGSSPRVFRLPAP